MRLSSPIAAARQRGFTLIELVVAITIVGIAASTIVMVLGSVAARSADAMVQQQAIAIAQAYLEEILQQPISPPAGAPTMTTRATYDEVDDYNGLSDSGAHDQFGSPIAALAAYNVSVVVSQSSALTGVPSAQARRVDVTVSTSPGVTVTLSGYRANYN